MKVWYANFNGITLVWPHNFKEANPQVSYASHPNEWRLQGTVIHLIPPCEESCRARDSCRQVPAGQGDKMSGAQQQQNGKFHSKNAEF